MNLTRPNRLHYRSFRISDFLGRPAEFRVFYEPSSLKAIHILNQGEGYKVTSDGSPSEAIISINRNLSVPCRIVTNERGNVVSVLPPDNNELAFLQSIRFSQEDGNEFLIFQKSWEIKYQNDLRNNYVQGKGCKISIDSFRLSNTTPVQVLSGGTNYTSSPLNVELVFSDRNDSSVTYPINSTLTISGGQITSVSVPSNTFVFTRFPIVFAKRLTRLYTNDATTSGTANAIWFVHIIPNKVPLIVTSFGRVAKMTAESLKEIPLFPNDSFRIDVSEKNDGLVGLQGISLDSIVHIIIYQYNLSSAPTTGTGLNLNFGILP